MLARHIGYTFAAQYANFNYATGYIQHEKHTKTAQEQPPYHLKSIKKGLSHHIVIKIIAYSPKNA